MKRTVGVFLAVLVLSAAIPAPGAVLLGAGLAGCAAAALRISPAREPRSSIAASSRGKALFASAAQSGLQGGAWKSPKHRGDSPEQRLPLSRGICRG